MVQLCASKLFSKVSMLPKLLIVLSAACRKFEMTYDISARSQVALLVDIGDQ